MKSKCLILFTELFSSVNLLRQLVKQQLILRYRRTMLGYLWTLVNPLLMMSLMAIVFSTLFKAELKTFAIVLFAGMIPWNFFSSVVTQSGSAFINNESLIKKIYIPKIIFPLSIALALLIDSLLSFTALFIIIVVVGGPISWALIFLPVSFFLIFIFAMSCGLIMSVATVFFRDLQYVITVAMQGLFYLTPILYKQDALTGKLALLVELNPITPFVAIFRAPLVEGTLPSAYVLFQSVAIVIVTLTISLFVFLNQEKKIVFRL